MFACFGVATCSPINEMASTLTTHSYTGVIKQSIIMVEPAWACGFTASTHLRFVAKIWWQSARVTDIGNNSMSFSSWAIDSGKKRKMAMPVAQQQGRCRLLWWHGSAQYEYWYYDMDKLILIRWYWPYDIDNMILILTIWYWQYDIDKMILTICYW